MHRNPLLTPESRYTSQDITELSLTKFQPLPFTSRPDYQTTEQVSRAVFRPSHWRRVTMQVPQGPSALLTHFWVDHLVPAHRTASSVLRWKAKKFIQMEPEQIHTPAVALCGTPTSLTYHRLQIHSPCIGELYALEIGFAMALYFQHLSRSLI